MKTETQIKQLFNQALTDSERIKKEWADNGNNFYGSWYNDNQHRIAVIDSKLYTLRQVLEYYSSSPIDL